MRIQEIIFQGIFASSTPVRLATAPGVDRMALPLGLSAANVHGLLVALFYPERMPALVQRDLAGSVEVKLAIVFEQGGKTFRLLRKNDPGSVRLQVNEGGGFRPLSTGMAETSARLSEVVGLPSFETFAALNLWRFDDDALYEAPDLIANEAGRRQFLVKQYKAALHLEGVEDAIKALESEIQEQRLALGKGSRMEEKLDQARQKLEELRVVGLNEQDLELLKQKDERLAEFDQQLDRLGAQEDQERRDLEQMLPVHPAQMPVFWVGLLLGVAALAVSIGVDGPYRPVAALNVVGVSVIAWLLLKYFTDLEQASVRQVRLESIKRRLNQVRDEEVTFREQVNHMLIHAGVEDEEQLFLRVEKSEQLEQIVENLQGRVGQMRANPQHRAAKQRIDALRAELEERRAERATLPADLMSSFQLEEDLRSLGVDPRAALMQATPEEQVVEVPQTTFGRLKLAADQTGQWQLGRLEPRVRKMWGKICGHILNERFKDVDLSESGELRIGEMSVDQLEMWRRTRASEEWIVGFALALALHVNAPQRETGFMETIWVEDPRQELGARGAVALDEVLASAAKKSHIVLCTT